jgi:hypothetical protein
MRIRFVLALCTIMACASGCLRAQPASTGMPLLDCSGLPCIDVTVAGGKHLRLLVDTGNVNSMLDRATAEQLGLSLQPVKEYPRYATAILPGVRAGDAALGDLEVLVVNLKPSIENGTMPVAEGTLAYTAFKDRIVTIDYRGRRLQVSALQQTDAPCPSFCGVMTYPTFGKHGPPIVATTGFRLNGKPVTVQVDTLYAGTMLIYPTSIEKLGLGSEQSSSTLRKFPFTDGGVDMAQGSAAKEGFGTRVLRKNVPVYFATPKVHVPDGMFDGTVGNELFLDHVLTLDFHANHLWIS